MKKLLPILVILLTGLLSTAAAQETSDSIRLSAKKKVPRIQYGIASYYHNKFQGRQTANGEHYDTSKFTAAHNGLPLGTWIKVTNTRNNKSVIVKVNDRLHYKNTRLVDLSLAAARKLAYIGRGLTRVKVEVLGKRKPKEAEDN